MTYRPDKIYNKKFSSRGAVLLQLAFSLPLILIGFYIFIWVATFIHARVVLRDSLQIAVKQGAVLGKDTVSFRSSESADDIASKIKLFRSNQPNGEYLVPLIVFRPDIPSLPYEVTYSDYLMRSGTTFSKIIGGIRAVPPEYLYSMVLVYEGIRSSLGTGNLKYPCSTTEFDTKPGCLTCVPIVRRQLNSFTSTPVPSNCLPRDSLSLECRYHASFPVLNTINKLFRILLKGGSATLAPVVVERIEGYATNSNMLVGNPNEKQERLNCPNL